MVGNELFNILGSETEYCAAVAKAHNWKARIAPSGVVAHPGFRHSKLAGNVIQRQQPRVIANYGERFAGHCINLAAALPSRAECCGWYEALSSLADSVLLSMR